MNLRSKLEELDVSRRVSTDLLMSTLSALFTYVFDYKAIKGLLYFTYERQITCQFAVSAVKSGHTRRTESVRKEENWQERERELCAR